MQCFRLRQNRSRIFLQVYDRRTGELFNAFSYLIGRPRPPSVGQAVHAAPFRAESRSERRFLKVSEVKLGMVAKSRTAPGLAHVLRRFGKLFASLLQFAHFR